MCESDKPSSPLLAASVHVAVAHKRYSATSPISQKGVNKLLRCSFSVCFLKYLTCLSPCSISAWLTLSLIKHFPCFLRAERLIVVRVLFFFSLWTPPRPLLYSGLACIRIGDLLNVCARTCVTHKHSAGTQVGVLKQTKRRRAACAFA